MKSKILFFLFAFIIVSCSERDTLPLKQSERIRKEASGHKPILQDTQNKALEELFNFVMQYNSGDLEFDLDVFKKNYAAFSNSFTNATGLNEAAKWFQINALLLELTSNELYAYVLESTIKANPDLNVVAEPLIVTKNADHLYVNLFQPIELNYPHTLGGDVSFKMETNYPESGSIQLHFGMSIKRYIELYIRIPEWAEGATVTVKKVKYLTQAGSYCKIAKKWKEGDLVEIEFPIEKSQFSSSNNQLSSNIQ